MAYMAESNGAKRSKLDEDSRVSTKSIIYCCFIFLLCFYILLPLNNLFLVEMVVVVCCLP